MNLQSKLKRAFYRRIVKPNIRSVYKHEDSIGDLPNAINPTEDPPIRFNIPMNIIELAEQGKPNNLANHLTMPPMISNIKNIKKAIRSINQNSKNPISNMEINSIDKLRAFCLSLGVLSVGFTKLPHNLIFKDKAVLFDNAIVLSMEMDRDRIKLAPHIKTGQMIMQTYNRLGIAANKVASYLRKLGYSAQASHPLGGMVVYPPLAQKAGLGWNGRHGLLITPECGPRVRLAAVFTNISNFPYSTENPHKWISKYCTTCGLCIKECPQKSLYTKSIHNQNGLITHNDSEKCFPYFASNYGCTICVKVCPFSNGIKTYNALKKEYFKSL